MHCGQNSRVDKINLSNLLKELSDNIFQINYGFFFTIKELFIRPGHSIREFIIGKRKNHFKPISYTLVLSTVYFIFSQIIDKKTFLAEFISGFSESAREKGLGSFNFFSTTLDWLINNHAYTTLFLIPLYSLASYIAFLGKGYNYLENVVINSYIIGQQAIIYSIFLIPSIFIANDYYIELAAVIFSITYAFWAFRTFYIKSGITETTLRSALIYFLNFVFLNGVLFVFILGTIILGRN